MVKNQFPMIFTGGGMGHGNVNLYIYDKNEGYVGCIYITDIESNTIGKSNNSSIMMLAPTTLAGWTFNVVTFPNGEKRIQDIITNKPIRVEFIQGGLDVIVNHKSGSTGIKQI